MPRWRRGFWVREGFVKLLQCLVRGGPLIGTCQVFGGPSGIAVTLAEVMDIRKSSRCEGWREEVVGWVTEQEKDSGGGGETSRTQRQLIS